MKKIEFSEPNPSNEVITIANNIEEKPGKKKKHLELSQVGYFPIDLRTFSSTKI